MATAAAPLLALLAQRAATSAQIQHALGVSQPTASRLIRELGTKVVRIGRGRSTRYALRRDLADIGSSWPVLEIDERGKPRPSGRLHALLGEQFWLESNQAAHSRIGDGLPPFIQDMRPQGFIGRTVPHRYPELGVPDRIPYWTDTHTLTYLVRRGEDCIGNVLIGEESLERFWQQHNSPVQVIGPRNRAAQFERLARAASEGQPAGSSAGGEHSKFTCVVESGDAPMHALVKFSPPGDDVVATRWRDLLVAEHLALQALTNCGVTAARSQIVSTKQRSFLQSERFDRVGLHGRRGVLSLAALDDEFLGTRSDWIGATTQDLFGRSRSDS
jgi:hypothetical protein